MFQLVRYREVGGTLARPRPCSTTCRRPSRSPPPRSVSDRTDGWYVAFEQAIDASSSEGSFNGRVLRLNPDGTTPRDQRGGSPVFASGARRPRGLDWDLSGALWIVDGDVLRTERLIGVQPDPASRGPRSLRCRAFRRRVRSVSSHRRPAGRGGIGAYVLRIHFDPANRQRVLGTERLLEGEVDAVRAIAVMPRRVGICLHEHDSDDAETTDALAT